ncbi:LysR family transcriptional regulator [Pyxidicoccus fallax]|uniref:LysR family transcriptional regulator n=1 Tax=Pyxidicoccus fallax TaxID=394095 RepID=A0A848LBY3_9BACT|nr:LysR family transcriptional regulator [Pyxidicoccus fallax]NMO14223.1 LysR family transcriptional regulator [Pyxidicoccus fallax]NPC80385.1 LysR family transcriptional regulator [Pyxidicoccus fallax]
MEYQSNRALEELAAFTAVVEANGFTAAARALRARKATLSQRVQELEERLGVSLLVRTTRSLRLTEEGRAYFEHARRSLAAARAAEDAVAQAKSKPSGLLRVTTSAAIAGMVLEPVVNPFLEKYPEVSIHLDTSVRRLNLVREGIDLALRVGPLDDSSLIARRLGRVSGGYYASPRYLQRRGAPSHPEELHDHATITIPGGEGPKDWPFASGTRKLSFRVKPRLEVSSFELAVRAAVAGLGIVRTPLYFASPFLARRQLVPVLEEWNPPGVWVHAVMPPGGALVPKTRLFLDALTDWFRQQGEEGA